MHAQIHVREELFGLITNSIFGEDGLLLRTGMTVRHAGNENSSFGAQQLLPAEQCPEGGKTPDTRRGPSVGHVTVARCA